MTSHWEARACTGRGLGRGLILLLIGTIFLLSNLGVLGPLFYTWWPLLLIGLGAAKLVGWYRSRSGAYSDFA